jgi:hypothetical protein
MGTNERWERLDRMIEEGRIVRREWGDGVERACLLLAVAPEVGPDGAHGPGACPATVMPQWLARLTPWIDDAGSVEHWPAVIRRYREVVPAARGRLDDAGWERCRCAVLTVIAEAVADAAWAAADADAADAVALAAARAASDRMIDGILDAIERAR